MWPERPSLLTSERKASPKHAPTTQRRTKAESICSWFSTCFRRRRRSGHHLRKTAQKNGRREPTAQRAGRSPIVTKSYPRADGRPHAGFQKVIPSGSQRQAILVVDRAHKLPRTPGAGAEKPASAAKRISGVTREGHRGAPSTKLFPHRFPATRNTLEHHHTTNHSTYA